MSKISVLLISATLCGLGNQGWAGPATLRTSSVADSGQPARVPISVETSVSPGRVPPNGGNLTAAAIVRDGEGRPLAKRPIAWITDIPPGRIVSSERSTDVSGRACMVIRASDSQRTDTVTALCGGSSSQCYPETVLLDAPSVRVVQPAGGSRTNGDVLVQFGYRDAPGANSGISLVALYIDDVLLSEGPPSFIEAEWRSYKWPNGRHSISVCARDRDGNVATSNIVTVTSDNVISEFRVDREEVQPFEPLHIMAALDTVRDWRIDVIDVDDSVVWSKKGQGSTISTDWPGARGNGLFSVKIVSGGSECSALVACNALGETSSCAEDAGPPALPELSAAGLLERDTGIGSAADITSVVARLRTGEAYLVTHTKASRLIGLVYRTLCELYPLTAPPIEDWDVLLINTEKRTYWLPFSTPYTVDSPDVKRCTIADTGVSDSFDDFIRQVRYNALAARLGSQLPTYLVSDIELMGLPDAHKPVPGTHQFEAIEAKAREIVGRVDPRFAFAGRIGGEEWRSKAQAYGGVSLMLSEPTQMDIYLHEDSASGERLAVTPRGAVYSNIQHKDILCQRIVVTRTGDPPTPAVILLTKSDGYELKDFSQEAKRPGAKAGKPIAVRLLFERLLTAAGAK